MRPKTPPTELAETVATTTDGHVQQRVRVLCVDDNPLILESLRRAIEQNASLEWVGSLERADALLDTVKRLCPDVVILDIYMPGAGAFDQLKRLNAECPDARVLVLSSDASGGTIRRARDCGAWGFISKYETFSIMAEAIEAVARGHKYFGSIRQ